MPVSYTHLDVYKRQVGALFQDKAGTKNSLIIPAVLVGGRKKKQDVKFPDYWDGNIYICGSIFIYGSDTPACPKHHCVNPEQSKDVCRPEPPQTYFHP